MATITEKHHDIVRLNQHAFKLSPSDFSFLWEECRCCYYNKVALGQPRPSTPFPKLFSRLDKLEKDYFTKLSTTEVSGSLPPGVFDYGEHWVESKLFKVPGHPTPFFIRGRFDVAGSFEDGTFGLVDYKTSSPADKHIPLYSRQLHAYALALEYPAQGSLKLSPISRMGILCVDPVEMISLDTGGAFRLETTWIEIPRSNTAFKAFLDQVLAVLESDIPPAPSPTCSFCQYRELAVKEAA